MLGQELRRRRHQNRNRKAGKKLAQFVGTRRIHIGCHLQAPRVDMRTGRSLVQIAQLSPDDPAQTSWQSVPIRQVSINNIRA